MSNLLYLNNTYLYECNALIVESNIDTNGEYLILDQTVFYPQGGGQPSDIGKIFFKDQTISVKNVRNIHGKIHHYLGSKINLVWNITNNQVKCLVEQNLRLLNARYHTSAHLVSNCIELLYPALKASKSHSYPNEAYVEFVGYIENADVVVIQNKINEILLNQLLTIVFDISKIDFSKKYYNLSNEYPSTLRAVQIGEFLPIPCGGTHVHSISEIGKINIHKVRSKNNITRIQYTLI